MEKQLISSDKNLAPAEKVKLVLLPGFSSKDEISEISGRGVGMDVVNTKIGDLRGDLNLESQLGKGTKITLSIPVSLSIFQGFISHISQDHFIIRSSDVQSIIKVKKDQLEKVTNQVYLYNYIGEALEIIDLRYMLLEGQIK